MSCQNFQRMNYDMPMVCGCIDCDDEFEIEDEYFLAKHLANSMSQSLKYHNVTVVSGYYYGFQFYVDEKYSSQFDLSKESEYCIDNDDAHYYFDMCRSEVIRKADAEKNRIRKWLERIAVEYGYEILVCVGIFSNGEAIYETRTPRTELKSKLIA